MRVHGPLRRIATMKPLHAALRIVVSGLRAFMIMLGISVVLFVLLNAAAAYALKKKTAPANEDTVFHHILGSGSPAGREVLARVFPEETGADLLRRERNAPNFEMHPGLHYMTARTDNRDYRMGVEGIRYDAGWNDDTVRRFLASRRDLIFLVGGSTTLGHGVSGNETITWYMNRAEAVRGLALNLGSQAYDLRREIEKLVYLLRSGYRPHAVVFLDGWNDIVGVARSNMRWQDKVIFHGFEVNRGEVAFTPGAPNVNYRKLFAESLPLVRLLRTSRMGAFGLDEVKTARDPFLDGFDFFEGHWMFGNWEQYASRNREKLRDELLNSYRANLRFLEDLSRAFGFRLVVVLQPMGFFDRDNRFVPERARKDFGYQHLASLRQLLRDEIAAGRLGMIDGSDWLAGVSGDRYIDIAHYSPQANAELARQIGRRLEAGADTGSRR